MKNYKIYIFIFLLIFLSSCWDGKTPEKCFYFNKTDLTITGYDSKCGGNIRIPDKIDNLYVQKIWAYSFKWMEITNLEFWKYLIEIGDSAFSWLKLKELVFPETMNDIWENAFANQEIETIKFPVSLSTIGKWAFKNSKIKNIEFYSRESDSKENNTYLKSLNIYDEAFKDNEILKLNIPMEVSFEGNGAFENNKITEVKISKLYKIWSKTFKNNKIENVEFIKSATKIWYEAFAWNKIKKVHLWENLDSISSSVFEGSKIEEIILSKNLKIIPKDFLKWHNLKKLEIPEWVEKIEEWAFSNNKIEILKFPKTLKIIWKDSFSNNLIKKLEIPEWVEKIEEWTFSNNKIEILKLPETLKTVWENTFSNNLIKSIELPKKIRIIGKWVFLKNKIIEVEIPNTLHDFSWIFDENVKIIKNDFIENISEEVHIPEYAYLKNDYNIKIMAERRWVKNISFFDAIKRCDDLVLAWYDDWRVPQIQEMKAILQYLEKNKENEAFLDGNYWTYRLTILSFINKFTTVFANFSHTFDGWKWEIIFDNWWEVGFNNDSIKNMKGERNSVCIRDIK